MADFKIALLGMCAILLAPPATAFAQTATVNTAENLRADPNGEIVGVLDEGTQLKVAGRRDRWVQVELEGWVWTRSLQVVDRGAYDLVVSAEEGENLRAAPSGGILGRLVRGALLLEQERVPGWVRVRRQAWIWGPSVVESSPAGKSAPAGERPARTPTRVESVRAENGAAILAGPDGDTLAHTRPGAELQLLAREGNWVRVRVEGWTWMPPEAVTDSTGEVFKVAPAQLATDPDRYRGRLISWELQYLSLERAEKIRTDFFEGEPFLLTRHPSGGYVYVAIPADQVADALALAPLERITVVGRVRAPASALTGSPILDLIEWVRSDQGR